MTTQARDFKFAGAIVQRLHTIGNGGLNSKFFSAHYAWFSHGRSHAFTLQKIQGYLPLRDTSVAKGNMSHDHYEYMYYYYT